MRIDPKTNNLIREGVPAVVNPTDLNAIEAALEFKDTYGANVSVITMGPPQAEQSLREAIAMGVDDAYLLTDRAFGGADTLATSYSLWKGIQKIEETKGKTDILFFGKVVIDGETGQVGPGVAVRLGYPVVTYTSKILKVDLQNRFIDVERRVEDGVEVVRVPIPCALTITEAANVPRQPTIDGLLRGKKANVISLNKDSVQADPKRIGLIGSPTYVKKVVVPPPKKRGEVKDASQNPKEVASWLIDRLTQIGAFGKKVSGGVIPDQAVSTNPDAKGVAVASPVPTTKEEPQSKKLSGEFGEVWVYVEQRRAQAARVAWELMGEGKRLAQIYGTKVCAIILGNNVKNLVQESYEYGADKVYLIEHPLMEDYRSESYGKSFAHLSNKYHPEVILMGGTYNGRDLAGVLATIIETGLIADCTSLDVDEKGGFNGTRPDFGGKELSTIVCPKNKPTMASVRTRVMKMPPRVPGKTGELVTETIELNEDEIKEKIVSFTPVEKAGARLEGADIVVSGGRGLGNPKNFSLVEDLSR